MKKFTYKSRQETILIDYICSSKITTKEILNEVKKYYNDNPYHNFLHALQVSSTVLFLSAYDFSIVELRTLFYAALFHDARHKGKVDILDEFISYSIAFDYLSKNLYKVWNIDFSILRRSIVWTVFKNRGNNLDKYSILLWDLDISAVWKDIYSQIYYWDIICFEYWVSVERWVDDFIFFKSLLKINKNIFLSPYVLKMFPNAASVIKERIKMPKNILINMIKTLRDEDITLDEFEKKFKKFKLSN